MIPQITILLQHKNSTGDLKQKGNFLDGIIFSSCIRTQYKQEKLHLLKGMEVKWKNLEKILSFDWTEDEILTFRESDNVPRLEAL